MRYSSDEPNLPWFFTLAALIALSGHPLLAADGQLEISVIDAKSGEPIPVRVQFTNDRGRKLPMRGAGLGRLGDHFYLPGRTTLALRRGGYLFHMDAGPEYRTQQGHFEIERHADDAKQVEMRRFANLADEGWWAGDFFAERPSRDLPIVAAAEGLHYAPTIAWRFAQGKWQASHASVQKPIDADDPYGEGRTLGPMAAVFEGKGGTLILVSDAPLAEPPFQLDKDATSLDVIRKARSQNLRVVAATPTAWELPVWIASGSIDAVALLTHQTEWERAVDKDPGGRPRDRTFYPGRQGLARWGQTVYHHLLNAGVRVTPVAGSGSGMNESPLGTNRTYAYLTNQFTSEAWWRAVASGAVVVTNGPLLRPSVGGSPPGEVFRLAEGETIDFQIALNLASREPVDYLEILKNGDVEVEVRLSDWASSGGRLPAVPFDDSGWFAVRAATGATDKYQFAMTAPYFVQSPAGPRVSRESVEFFLAWLEELAPRVGESASCTAEELDLARQFWQSRLAEANSP